MANRILRVVLFVGFVGATAALAQSPDVTELKNKLRQLELSMQELKSQIAVVEQQQATPAQPFAATKPQESAVPPPRVAVEHMGETTRLREVASDNPEGAGRINNEPMDRALRGYFRL